MIKRGEEIDATLVERVLEQERLKENKRYPASRWIAESPDLPNGWSGLLRSITGKLYAIGDSDTFWIWDISEQSERVLLSDSNFGRMPISDRMRPRYIRGLRALLTVISPHSSLADVELSDLSEANGFFERCARRNQWDWFTAWEALDFANIQLLRNLRNAVKTLRVSIRSGNSRGTNAARKEITKLLSSLPLQKTLDALTASVPHLPQSSLGSFQSNIPTTERHESTQLTAEARQRLERANAEHKAAQEILERILKTKGYVVEHSRYVDVYARLKSGPAIFEVKSITPNNERSQCRHALSQLYEYRYLHQVSEASLWLVLSQAPENEWIVSYLSNDRGINVLWCEGESIAGPSVTQLDTSSSQDTDGHTLPPDI